MKASEYIRLIISKDAEIAALQAELEKQKAAYAALWKDRDEQEHTRAEYFQEIAALREALRHAVDWNYEYERINNLCGGHPYWVEWVERVMAEGQPKEAK